MTKKASFHHCGIGPSMMEEQAPNRSKEKWNRSVCSLVLVSDSSGKAMPRPSCLKRDLSEQHRPERASLQASAAVGFMPWYGWFMGQVTTSSRPMFVGANMAEMHLILWSRITKLSSSSKSQNVGTVAVLSITSIVASSCDTASSTPQSDLG